MDPGAFCAQARLLIVAGKGGVGKTTVSAAMARLASRTGRSSLIVDIEGKSDLGNVFGYTGSLTYQEAVLAAAAGDAGEVRARTLTPDDALVEYLIDHGMQRISRRLASSGALDVVATAVPGIKDILVLGKVKQLEMASAAGTGSAPDYLVLDAPAAGHAMTFLASAQGLLDAVTVGPIRSQAADVVAMLGDPARCQVMLVTLPEETPVNEVVETAYRLEDRVGVHLTPIVVNGVYPPYDLGMDPAEAADAAGIRLTSAEMDRLRAAAAFRRNRQELQATQIRRLAEALPLPQLHLPYLFSTELGLADIDALADRLTAELARVPLPTAGRRSAPPRGPTGGGTEGSADQGAGGAAVPGRPGRPDRPDRPDIPAAGPGESVADP